MRALITQMLNVLERMNAINDRYDILPLNLAGDTVDTIAAANQYLMQYDESKAGKHPLATKPNCKECARWMQEEADNNEWIDAVAKGREICRRLAEQQLKGTL